MWQQAWLQHSWDEEWKPLNILAKELVPIAIACAVWGPDWRCQRVLVHCDNMAVAQVITAQSSKDFTLMHLLGCIHFFCAVGDFKPRAVHIPGSSNMPADAVSCNHLEVFFNVPPPRHTGIPPQFRPHCGVSCQVRNQSGDRPPGGCG